ncbi:LysR family transcriptional regulator [Bosea sp. (in: a-proteobacteria)]|uniref:LysR family transcriptional regulator n=1 Tax=Bosea sp. (in: a-proteobacteria) TaxID=1871050 RepID=UPI002606F9BD|nr:LysR family transcriptional regulator [Bosea sp. (in: a-proteobacteria)]MCO5091852.1 LysR family transcriptional regulator [Bosea sp. (in: a-proteobacteria)]
MTQPGKGVPVPNLQDVDLRLLRVFVSVATNGSFTAAQTELNIGVSTISGYISKLEARLNVHLCQRGRSGFRLTEAGTRLLDASRILFDDLDRFRARVGEARQELTGRFVIGMVDAVSDLAGNIVPECLRAFTDKAPLLHLDLKLGSPRALVSELIAEDIDAAILPVFRKPAAIDLISLDRRDPQSLYCGLGHPFFHRADQDIETGEIRSVPFVHRAHMEGWSRYSAQGFNAMATTVDVECQLILVLTGKYISYLPERYAADWCRRGLLRKIGDPHLQYESNVCLAVRSGDNRATIRTLVAAAHAVIAARGPRD